MKTRKEVEVLKAQWLKDPCWDIESTDGFEEYGAELAGFAVEHRKLQEETREKVGAQMYRDTLASEATLRDMFAAHAMEGELASVADTWNATDLAERSYRIADAMMAARKKTPA